MKPQDAADHFGGQSRLAEAVGVTPQRVGQWIEQGTMPLHHAARVFIDSGGKVPISTRDRALMKQAAELYAAAMRIDKGRAS